ncbi:MAG: DNA recombination protein RmuC [Chloroflexi bacterium]|nr:DNA recombination protein RmuC [Chloroflexota bacterium]
MEAVIIVLLLALLALAGAAVWLLTQRRPAHDPAADGLEQQRQEQQLATLRAEMAQVVNTSQQAVLAHLNSSEARVNTRLDAVQSSVGQSLTATTETIGKIGEQLGGLNEAAKRIQAVGEDVSSLKDVLQPPKLRGGFGELLLEQLVKQVLPAGTYQTQYRFKDGTIVDLVVETPDGLVPIDSKFPVESFRRIVDAPNDEERTKLRKAFIRDVRARVEEVAKYIQPDENTMDFACMYVPAENIFYETLVGTENESAMTFALERQVQLVSPNTFYALLQIVARGFGRQQIQENVKEFMAMLGQVQRDFDRFRQELDVLGTHLGHAKNKYDDVDKLADRLSSRLALSVGDAAQPLPEHLTAQPALPKPVPVNGSDDAE